MQIRTDGCCELAATQGQKVGDTSGCTRPSLKLNAVSSWLPLVTNIAIGFFLTPALAKHLGDRDFGIWLLVSSIIGYFGLLKFGIGTGIIRYLPLATVEGDKGLASEIVSTAFFLFSLLGVVVASLCLVLAGPLSDFFNGGTELALLIRLVGLAAGLQFPTEILDSAIRGQEQYHIANAVEVMSAITRAAVLIGCMALGLGITQMGVGLVVTAIGSFLFCWLAFRMGANGIRISLRTARLEVLKPLFLFGLALLISGFAELLTYESPKQIIAKVLDLKAVAFYGVAVLLARYYRQVVYAVTKVFMPRFSYLLGQGAKDEIKTLFIRGTRYIAILSCAIAALMFTTGPSLIRLWMGESYFIAWPVLIIVTFASLALTSNRLCIDLMYGLGREYFVAAIDFVEGLAIFITSVILCQRFGLIGVALGITVPVVLIRSAVPLIACRLADLNYRQYLIKMIGLPYVILACVVTPWYVLGASKLVSSWARFVFGSGIVLLLYSVLAYTIILNPKERASLLQFLNRNRW